MTPHGVFFIAARQIWTVEKMSNVTSTPAQETDWKAEARKWEERSKANKSELDALTDKHSQVSARVSELESLNAELAGKVSSFESAKAHLELVSKVSEATGIDAKALRGETEEELTEHAEYLKGLIGSQPSAPVIPSQAKRPDDIPDDPNLEAVRSLFGSE